MTTEQQDLYLLADTEEAREMNQHIIDLLKSNENENMLLAFQLIEGGGLSNEVERYLRYNTAGNTAYRLIFGVPKEGLSFRLSVMIEEWFGVRYSFANFINGEIKSYEFYAQDGNAIVFDLKVLACPTKKRHHVYRVTCGKNSHMEFRSVTHFIDSLSAVVKHSMKFKINILHYGHQKIYAKNIYDKIQEIPKPANCKITCETIRL